MASPLEIMLHLSEEDLQTLSKEELGITLFSLIRECGSMKKELQVLHKINNQLTKIDSIHNTVDRMESGTVGLNERLSALDKKIRELETTRNDMDNSDLLQKLEELDQRFKDNMNKMSKGHEFQQRFLEQLDAKSRRNNLIVLGVTETADTSDLEKIRYVVKKTGVSLHRGNFSIQRLGSTDGSHVRPIMLKLDCHKTRMEILTNARKLKEDSDCANIFIRKDTHPAIRCEMNRLRIKERNEKLKPENYGAEIKYDREGRVLMKDGIIIDRFCPVFQ